ncbi:ubiquitin domain-containing protein UBFD1 isoform X1 [Zootoca vivipara]|uniref:ubiquitin domain-containing protein UBFD1 isoform X1 n=2 Tax=Zootoca vivipara TaxID=8524 RepID=UPI00158FD493|nr:ubiquitin domain-containing protein UBFD1 isoform X1 [Zootoca vivipara]
MLAGWLWGEGSGGSCSPKHPDRRAKVSRRKRRATEADGGQSRPPGAFPGTPPGGLYTIMAAASASPDSDDTSMDAEAENPPLGCRDGSDPLSAEKPLETDDPQSDPPDPQASVSNGSDSETGKELVELKVIWNKNKYDLKFPLDNTGADLKQKIHSLTGLPPAMQKVMFKGLLPEDKTLREIKVINGAKIMVVGSTINDVLAVNTPKDAAQQEVKSEETKKEPLCRQKQHRKVLDKGKPEDVMPSVKGAQERLPTVPLSGMYNKSGGKVRLTFKLEQDQLWIGTKERTEKLPMGSIKNVVSEPIEGHEDYHMMAFQLGPTEASYYWVYWVPTQYVDAIKDTVLGKWQYF